MTLLPFARRLTLLLALAATPAVAGCANQSLALIGGVKVDDATINQDPIALLPRGVQGFGYLDAAAMFRTKWGPDVAALINNLLPLGAELNFVPERDVVRVYGGAYALQGADFCAVVQGSFDVAAIRKAADARAITIGGAPLVKSSYAGNDMFTSRNIGFVVLTSHTVLTGNETGMRRALDRLRSGKLTSAVPPWMVELAHSKAGPLIVAGEPAGPAVQTAAQVVPFVTGVQRVRVVGNFEPPGMNLAGSLAYPDAAAAKAGAEGLQNAQRYAAFASLFVSLGGLSIPPIQTATKEGEVTFTIPVDESLLRQVMRLLTDVTRHTVSHTAPGKPAPR